MRNYFKIIILVLAIAILSGCDLFKSEQAKVTIDYNCEGVKEYNCSTSDNKLNCILIMPECKGYSFDGWYDEKTGGNEVNLDADFKESTTIYARWVKDGSTTIADNKDDPSEPGSNDPDNPSSSSNTKANSSTKYSVSFDLNGGNGKLPSKVSVKYDSMMPDIDKTIPTRSNYVFMGWYDNKNYTLGDAYYNELNEPSKYYNRKKNITLYAGWKKKDNSSTTVQPTANSYIISFNANNGTGSVPASVNVKNGQMVPEINKNIPTRSGYIFKGWYDNVDYTKGKVYYNELNEPTTYYEKNDSITLYAGWGKDMVVMSYKIIFNANGGSGGQTSSVSVKNGESLPKITSTPPTKKGYTFQGWYDSLSGGTIYYNSSGAAQVKFYKKLDITLYARWKANTYTVSFDVNGGTGNVPDSVTATFGVKMPVINNNIPTRDKHMFLGWYDNEDYANGKTYYSDLNESAANMDVDKPLTLYAGWSKLEQSEYIVTFNSNGGTGGQVSSIKVKKNADMPNINTTAPTKVGYVFSGWYGSLTGGKQYYTAECKSARKYDKNSGITLYAHYTPITYKLSYNYNGGKKGDSAPTDGKFDVNLKIDNPTKVFAVTIDSNKSGATLGSTKVTSKQEFIGWTADNNLDTKYAKYGKRNAVTNNWSSQSSKITDTYFVNLMSTSGTVALTANWKQVNVVLPSITKNGYVCGYSTTSDGTIVYDSKGTYTPSITGDSAKLYAICTKGIYVVAFDANGGTGGQSAQAKASYGEEMPAISSEKPVKEGYTFLGWYDAKSGGKQYYTEELKSARKYDKSKGIILYAQYKVNKYTVTFDANGGKIPKNDDNWKLSSDKTTATKSVKFDLTYGTLPKPTMTGYTFVGWYTAKTDGTKVDKTTVVKTAKNHTLYAQWEEFTYKVSFNANGGTGTMDNQKIKKDVETTLTTNTFTKTGYRFVGWNTKASGSGTNYANNAKIKISKDITLYAQWGKDGQEIKVASLNIGYFNCGSSKYKCMVDNEEQNSFKIKNYVVRTIKDETINLIGLQDARDPDLGDNDSPLKNRITEMANTLKNDNYYNYISLSKDSYNAVLSNIKFSSEKIQSLPSGKQVSKMIINVKGVNISYYNAHLSSDANEKEFKSLAEMVEKDSNPVIITGGFNNYHSSRYTTYLKPLGFVIASHDNSGATKNIHGQNHNYDDSIYVRPYGTDKVSHIDILEHKTIVTYKKYSNHNLVITKLLVY